MNLISYIIFYIVIIISQDSGSLIFKTGKLSPWYSPNSDLVSIIEESRFSIFDIAKNDTLFSEPLNGKGNISFISDSTIILFHNKKETFILNFLSGEKCTISLPFSYSDIIYQEFKNSNIYFYDYHDFDTSYIAVFNMRTKKITRFQIPILERRFIVKSKGWLIDQKLYFNLDGELFILNIPNQQFIATNIVVGESHINIIKNKKLLFSNENGETIQYDLDSLNEWQVDDQFKGLLYPSVSPNGESIIFTKVEYPYQSILIRIPKN